MAVILFLVLSLLLAVAVVEALLQMVTLVVQVVVAEMTAVLLEMVVLVQAVKETLAVHLQQMGQDPVVVVAEQVRLALQTLVRLVVQVEVDRQLQLLVLLLHTQGAGAVEVTQEPVVLAGLAGEVEGLISQMPHLLAMQIQVAVAVAVEIRR